MSIGEVLAQLRADFPDVTISKLRFLETEGLVEPRRTPAGYRKYTWTDIARLRYVLTAQRDQYLPLRVIREHLATMGDPLTDVSQAVPVEAPVEIRLTRDELLDKAGLGDATLRALEEYGLLRARPGGGYDADALEVATAAARLAEFGVEPRHLRAYRAAADREVGLFSQLVSPMTRHSNPAARARAADTVHELAALTQRVHAALVRAGLREILGK
ncbi:MerR family transcriptional regulator [Dactylosporangium aurantiacum]|uniref:MerR family transcriptional regulator n=1 Tax=Dactylosporangium aurantiacum TaxID=35754 RepID=A0A9Q9MF03_9ACTN|nr:MerR family transcriptional regulator [Dactylosporangium aurantiacum]MDG6103448.1 MerR family transcriptional regulator [Dactylosporangium aurantiacum]UWZ52045.1 MerR family transcriptional regulator [Dactylosporangium aurantiacum]